MKFKDIVFNKEHRFSLGVEEESGKYYLAIPVSSGFVDYEEYYEIDEELVNNYETNINLVLGLLSKCRNREMDRLLIQKPGRNRGIPV